MVARLAGRHAPRSSPSTIHRRPIMDQRSKATAGTPSSRTSPHTTSGVVAAPPVAAARQGRLLALGVGCRLAAAVASAAAALLAARCRPPAFDGVGGLAAP